MNGLANAGPFFFVRSGETCGDHYTDSWQRVTETCTIRPGHCAHSQRPRQPRGRCVSCCLAVLPGSVDSNSDQGPPGMRRAGLFAFRRTDMNDSASGGYLLPQDPVPDTDAVLEAFLQAMVSGVTGLPAEALRPMWPEPDAPEPAAGDACELAITAVQPDANAVLRHDGGGEGNDVYARHHDITLLCRFLGPAARGYAERLIEGLAVPQNREALARADMAILGAGPVAVTAERVAEQWQRRHDVTVRLRRRILRSYPVRNLLSADVATGTDAPSSAANSFNDQ